VQDNDKAGSPWLRHKEAIAPRAKFILLQNGVDLDNRSWVEVTAMEDAATEALLANSMRRLDQVSVLTWVSLMLFGVCRSMGTDPTERKNAREALKALLKPVHEEVDSGVATFISRTLWKS